MGILRTLRKYLIFITCFRLLLYSNIHMNIPFTNTTTFHPMPCTIICDKPWYWVKSHLVSMVSWRKRHGCTYQYGNNFCQTLQWRISVTCCVFFSDLAGMAQYNLVVCNCLFPNEGPLFPLPSNVILYVVSCCIVSLNHIDDWFKPLYQNHYHWLCY